MKRTNIILDEKVIREAQKATGIATVRGVVDYALQELLRHHRQRNLLKLRGRVQLLLASHAQTKKLDLLKLGGAWSGTATSTKWKTRNLE
jgi:Arc/MetJ family transcription regulator